MSPFRNKWQICLFQCLDELLATLSAVYILTISHKVNSELLELIQWFILLVY